MATWLKQSTSADVPVGPFLDETDGKTAETALTITQPDVRLKKNNGNWAQKNAAQTLAHEENGWYEVTLDATDTNTLGVLVVAVHEAGALPVWREFLVLPANVYDSLVSASDLLQVDVQELEGDAQSSLDLKDFADAGYDPATNKVEGVKTADALTANNDKTGYGLADGAITAAKLAADAITSAKIQDGALTAAKFASGAYDAVWSVATRVLTAATNITASIADAVWDEDVDASHQTAGSAGKKLDDAGAAGDPWATTLPGAYGQGTAGHILGHQRSRAGTAQAGAGGSITLDGGASASNDFYNNLIVQIVAGAGAGQSRIVADYTGATKVATVNGNWITNPDNTSVFVVYPFGAIPGASAPTAAEVADAVWDEAGSGHTASGSFGARLDVTVSSISGATGSGALTRTIGVTVGGNPLEGASVWVSTDVAGTNVIAGPLTTTSMGIVTILVDAGTFYLWAQKDGYDAILAEEFEVTA